MYIPSYEEFINESKGMPDIGETVQFEDSFTMKNQFNGEKVEITSEDEFEVVSVSGLQMELKGSNKNFFMTNKEFKKLGGKIV